MVLTKEHLEQLKTQYYSLSDELDIYRKNMKCRKYINTYPKSEREKHLQQYKFLKFAINETISALIDHGYADNKILKSALFNRFLKFKTRFKAAVNLYYNKLDEAVSNQ